MIPVTPQPEPADFGVKVRDRGRAWLKSQGLPTSGPLPPKTDPKPCWRDCLDELYESYGGVCAFLAVFFERATGAGSVDHFLPKSLRAEAIYEWTNYRLATRTINSRKGNLDGILDPFTLGEGSFHLELVSGSIYPNPKLTPVEQISAQTTIDTLGLDDPLFKAM